MASGAEPVAGGLRALQRKMSGSLRGRFLSGSDLLGERGGASWRRSRTRSMAPLQASAVVEGDPAWRGTSGRGNFSDGTLSDGDDGNGEEDADAEEVWNVHPLQTRGCSLCMIRRLTRSSLRQVEALPFSKKKRVSGLREVESTLGKLDQRLRSERSALSAHEATPDMQQALGFLQDTLTLLGRKFGSVARRSYFLDAAYGRRILVLHQSLSSAMNDVFLALSRAVMHESVETRARDSTALSKLLRDMPAHSDSVRRHFRGDAVLDSLDAITSVDVVEEHKHADGSHSVSSSDSDIDARSTSSTIASGSASCGLGSPRNSSAGSIRSRARTQEAVSTTPRRQHHRRATSPDLPDVICSPRSVARSTASWHSPVQSPRSVHSPSSAAGGTQLDQAQCFFEAGKLSLRSALGLEQDEDDRKAVIYFARAAQLGSVPSMLALGRLYERGVGCERPDLDLARHFFTQAADHDAVAGKSALARFQLRHLGHARDRGVATDSSANPPTNLFQDGEEDDRLAERAAAAAGLDEPTRRKAQAAVAAIASAARAGDADAQCALAEFTLHGAEELGVKASRERAKALLGLAAKQDHARAQNDLGVLLLQEAAHRKDGLRLLEISAGKGYAKAQNNLGMWHERVGRPAGDSEEDASDAPDLSAAIRLYRRAASQGLPLAMFNLGCALLRQAAQRQDEAAAGNDTREAIALLSCAAASGVADAHYFLAVQYQSGRGPDAPNFALAKEHYQCVLVAPNAAPATVARAMHQLANLLYREQQFSSARALYERCAYEHTCADSFNALGIMLEDGHGPLGQPDCRAAARAFEQAQRLGSADAAVNLAALHLRGAGVDRDLAKARNLLRGAPDHPRADALLRRIRLEDRSLAAT